MEDRRQIIMMVDDNITNLDMGKEILKDRYTVFPIPSGVRLLEILARISPDLILLDIEMPVMDGYAVFKALKSVPSTADIPVIFLTAKSDPDSELIGLNLGAVDYISKPFSPALLLKRIENHLLISSQKRDLKNYNENLQQMVQTQIEQIMELQSAVISSVVEMVEFRDTVTFGHIVRTQKYLNLLVDKLMAEGIYKNEISSWDLSFLIPSAQLHDVGKIRIPIAVLNKPGRYTEEEFNQMKNHTTYGVEIIERIARNTKQHTFLDYAKNFAATHHEKWDGTGYPLGLTGENIPLEGRLMALADVYDALISERPYKPVMSPVEAEKIIIAGKGAHFDPVLVEVFQTLRDDWAGRV
ncbi:MAG: response regulator [Treponema sp.]|jgi:putative two-component system response regulator|nr:response regulator [Treponema sp.]